MKHIFTKYKLQLVKEESGKYEVNNNILTPQEAYEVLTKVCRIQDECEEVLYLLTLNTKNGVNGIFEVSRGSLSSSMVHPREVLKRVLLNNSASFMLAHNHPSGDSTPSKEDINITLRLQECGKILGVELLDHLIVGDKNYCSLKEKGIM